ncbi:MAG TPA: LysR family transcriptional regulator [Rhodocyclaceae bacterium]|nr:LysR family transcriptional regulator [Rhodocyclaceae bacterium]
MDRLDAMKLFMRVAETGSFSGVALQMDVARSVVTRQIAGLEAHLGTKLIARSTRRLSLTSAGAAYLEKCREILNLVEEAETGLAEDLISPRGNLRVSLPISLGLGQLTPLLSDFTTAYPAVTVDLDFSDRKANLIEEGLDLAIRITRQLEPTDVARKLSRCQIVTVASPAYLARHGRPGHPRELIQGHECFGYTLGPRGHWTFLVDGEATAFPVRGRVQANNGDALLGFAARGLGISQAPTFIANPAIAAGQVEAILTDFPLVELGIYAVFPGNRYVPHRVRVLADYLAERIGTPPFWER